MLCNGTQLEEVRIKLRHRLPKLKPSILLNLRGNHRNTSFIHSCSTSEYKRLHYLLHFRKFTKTNYSAAFFIDSGMFLYIYFKMDQFVNSLFKGTRFWAEHAHKTLCVKSQGIGQVNPSKLLLHASTEPLLTTSTHQQPSLQ